MRDSDRASILRLRVIGVCIVLMGLVFIGRLYQVQIVQGKEFSQLADRQYAATPGTLYDRGSIYLSDKNDVLHSAGTLGSGFIIAVNPRLIEDAEAAYLALSDIIDLDQEDFIERASKEDDPYEEVAKRVPKEATDAILELDIPGVQAFREQWRKYPGDSLAAHVIGFVGFAGDEYSGRYGIERQYEKVLQRELGDVYTNFFAEVFSGVNDLVFRQESGKEGDVVLTIEPRVQSFAEEMIVDIQEEWQSSETGVVIIDPTTGEIFAMAAVPTFNVNEYNKEKSPKIFSNPLVERVYEMGSILKPLTMAAALDAEVVNAATTYNDKGYVEADGYRIENYDGKARGVVSMQEVLNQSLNTGVVFVEQHLGHDRYRDFMKSLGFSDKTGIDLPGEATGLTDNLDSRKDIEYYTASFGQGIAMTPISMVRALSVLGNGGYLIKPHVVKRLDYNLGFSEDIPTVEQGRVLSRTASDEITRMLVEVVDEALLGGTVALDRYSIAAKTGTAQIADPDNGGYYDDRYLHSFFGYFPAYEPRFLIFIYTKEPVGARYASHTLTHPFMDSVKFLTSYYEVPPDR